MNIEERYEQARLEELIRVVESSNDYRPEAVEAARVEIRRRNPSQSDLLKTARVVIKEHIDRYLDSFSVVNDSLVLPKSAYLNEEEVKLVFRAQFTARKNEFDDMIPESWKYVLGGF